MARNRAFLPHTHTHPADCSLLLVLFVLLLVVVVVVVVVVGSCYVRDGTFLWHREGRNAVNTSIHGVWMVPVHRRIILAVFAATCLEH